MNKTLSLSFYQSKNVVQIAKQLLGKVLCTNIDGSICKAVITETEAYEAPLDKASHAYGLRRTKRTEVMYQQGGVSYVYLCYGIHKIMNVVTGPKELPHAILLRAAEPIYNWEKMQERVTTKKAVSQLCSGPGNLCKALGINLAHNVVTLNGNLIWIEEGNEMKEGQEIISSPRVGIKYAEECAHWNYRFRIKNHPSNSKPQKVNYGSI